MVNGYNLSNELQQEGLSFAEARPLLTWSHERFIEDYGPHASGKIRMKLRDIAHLNHDDIKEINDCCLDSIGAITRRLGYAPILNAPSSSISAPQETQSEMAPLPLALHLRPRYAFWKQEPESDEAFPRAIDRVAID